MKRKFACNDSPNCAPAFFCFLNFVGKHNMPTPLSDPPLVSLEQIFGQSARGGGIRCTKCSSRLDYQQCFLRSGDEGAISKGFCPKCKKVKHLSF